MILIFGIIEMHEVKWKMVYLFLLLVVKLALITFDEIFLRWKKVQWLGIILVSNYRSVVLNNVIQCTEIDRDFCYCLATCQSIRVWITKCLYLFILYLNARAVQCIRYTLYSVYIPTNHDCGQKRKQTKYQLIWLISFVSIFLSFQLQIHLNL